MLFAQGQSSDGLTPVAVVKIKFRQKRIPPNPNVIKIMDSLSINKSNADLFAICFVRDKSCLMILDAHIMESQQDKLVLHYSLYYFYVIASNYLPWGQSYKWEKGVQKGPKTCMLNECPLYYSKHSLPHDFFVSMKHSRFRKSYKKDWV